MQVFKITVLSLVLIMRAHAQGYAPDIGEIQGEGFAFAADPALSLAGGGTLEFWVAAEWEGDPGFNPVIVANNGPEGAAYAVAMLPERDGLVVLSGGQEEAVVFDFGDGQMHHVAITHFEKTVAVLIDGAVRGVFDMDFLELPSAGVWVGSADGKQFPFTGAVAGMRFWGVPIDLENLVLFSRNDVLSVEMGDHPDVVNLRAVSSFETAELFIVDTVEEN